MQQVVVFGAGGFGREVAWLAEEIAAASDPAAQAVACFADENQAKQGLTLNDLPVKSLALAHSDHPRARLAVAVGSPQSRRTIVAAAAQAGWSFATLVHPRVERSRWIDIGEGSIICAGCILTTNIRIGAHVHVNLDCTIGHDAILEDFATLAPGVHVSGHVRIEAGAYVGTGAAIINGHEGRPLVIGHGAVVGAGACVTKDVPAGATFVGVPARAKGT